MLPIDFKRWRQMLGLTQAQAGERFGVSRVTIQNWEGGMTPIPVTAESHWLRLRRQQPDYGPVVLHYIHHLPMRPSPEAMPGLEAQFDRPVNEKYRSVAAALDRVRSLTGGAWSDFYLTDEAGVTVMDKGEVAIQAGRHGAADKTAPTTRSPEEVEAEYRDLSEFVKRFREEHGPITFLTDDDLYDEHGLPK